MDRIRTMFRTIFRQLHELRAEASAATQRAAASSTALKTKLEEFEKSDDPMGAFVHELANRRQVRLGKLDR